VYPKNGTYSCEGRSTLFFSYSVPLLKKASFFEAARAVEKNLARAQNPILTSEKAVIYINQKHI